MSSFPPLRRSLREPDDDCGPNLDWTLALAGGDGLRLQEYVARRLGERVPKQYCRLIGASSLLESTLDRMNQITPPSRTLTVIGTDHAGWAGPQLEGRSDHVFCQPSSRDTAVASYVALAMIKRWHPNATVTIVPTDHHVAPTSRYLDAVREARAFAARVHDLVVLLGVEPTEPDPDLGYIVRSAALTNEPDVREVAVFIEKPALSDAVALCNAGALWNTMVTCGSVSALWELGRAAAPHLLETLDSLVPLVGTEDEDAAIEYIYRAQPACSFSRDICQRAVHRVAALRMAGVDWLDLGQPARVESLIARSGLPMPS